MTEGHTRVWMPMAAAFGVVFALINLVNIVLRAVLVVVLAGLPAFACPADGDGDGVVRLRPEVLSRFDANHALVEAKRAPLQLVDFVAPKSRHRCEQEDLERLRVIGSEFVARTLDQARNIERGAVARDSDLLDLDARERQRLRQFDEFAHA